MESHLGGFTLRKQAATCKPREMTSRETTLIFTLSLDCQLHQKYGTIFRYYSIALRRYCSEQSTVLTNSEVLPVFLKASYPTCSETAQCCPNVSAGKGTGSRAWWPEFHPGTIPHSHRGRWELTPTSCPLNSTHVPWHVSTHTHKQTHVKKISVILWTVDNCLGVAVGLRK